MYEKWRYFTCGLDADWSFSCDLWNIHETIERREKKWWKKVSPTKLNEQSLRHCYKELNKHCFAWGSCDIFFFLRSTLIIEQNMRSTFFLGSILSIFVIRIPWCHVNITRVECSFFFLSFFFLSCFDNSKNSKVFTTYLRSTTSFTLHFLFYASFEEKKTHLWLRLNNNGKKNHD